MRLLLVFIVLAAVVLISFFLWGDVYTNLFSADGAILWVAQFREWGWLVCIGLLISDLLLPLPSTIIMAASGYLYGTLWGGAINATGSFASGVVAYWLCRMMGKKTAVFLLGHKDYDRGTAMAAGIGVWLVVISRWLPVFPEVIACMAGLTRMPVARFHLALLSASVPLGYTYAYVGAVGIEMPWLAIILSAGLPPLIWLWLRKAFAKQLGRSA